MATDNVTTGSYTISCTRLATDANSLAWSLAANNGLQSGGGNNLVNLAGNRYAYDIYIDPAHTTKWQAGIPLHWTLSFGASLSASVTGSFDLVVFGSQAVQPAGTYTDTVTVTLRTFANNNTLDTSPFTVSVITTNSCQLYTPPGNINLAYTSFQASAATANTSFGVRCTTALPYTMALDATSGTIVGLNYTLALSQTSATGNGLVQSHSVNGSIAGGSGHVRHGDVLGQPDPNAHRHLLIRRARGGSRTGVPRRGASRARRRGRVSYAVCSRAYRQFWSGPSNTGGDAARALQRDVQAARLSLPSARFTAALMPRNTPSEVCGPGSPPTSPPRFGKPGDDISSCARPRSCRRRSCRRPRR